MTLIFHRSTNSASETNHRRRTKRRRRTNHQLSPSINRPREDEEQTIISDLQSIDEDKTKNKPSSSSEMSKNRREMTEKTRKRRKNRERKKGKGKKNGVVLPTILHVFLSFIKKPIRKPQIKERYHPF